MNTKLIDAETVKLENRLEDLRQEVDRNMKAKESLIAEISKRTDDFNNYMAMKDAEVKKSQAELSAQREDLARQKTEFQDILKQHQLMKIDIEKQKREFDIQRLKTDSKAQNVQEFITAVRRAVGLLDI